jgi:elongation factor G
MDVSISVPQEFQASIMTQINKRKGAIYDTSNEGTETDGWATLRSKVSLKEMFGYVSDLRAATQGKGEFTMEFSHYQTVMRNEQEDLMKEYQKELEAKKK